MAKPISRNKKNYRPTKKWAWMTKAGVKAYRKANPWSKLQTAVTEKKPTGKRATRRKSYCARSKWQQEMHGISCKKTPNKRICQARKRWKCTN